MTIITETPNGTTIQTGDHVAFIDGPPPKATDSPAYRAFLARIFGQPQDRPLTLSRGPEPIHISGSGYVCRKLNRKG
jgi:hypothetical protein